MRTFRISFTGVHEHTSIADIADACFALGATAWDYDELEAEDAPDTDQEWRCHLAECGKLEDGRPFKSERGLRAHQRIVHGA